VNISEREKRLLVIWVIAVVAILIFYFWPQSDAAPEVVGGGGSVAEAEQQLERVRALAAQAPAREEMRNRLQAELEEWEAGLIDSETGQQAQAEVLQILRQVASDQAPPLEFNSVEIGQLRGLGNSEDYGEALVTVSFTCAVEQLVNMLADLTARPEAVVTDEIRISPNPGDDKLLRVRMSAAGLVNRSLIPAQRPGLGGF
jgi:hypothetical protein